MNKIAIMSDLHFPYQDQKLVDRACLEVKEEKPDVIVIDGDLLDFPGLSKYGNNPALSAPNLEDQLTQAWSFLSDLRKENPKAKIYYIQGNHDFRIQSYVIRETAGMNSDMREKLYRYIDLEKDLDLAKNRIEYVATMLGSPKWTDTYIDIDGIKIGHFDVVSNPTIPAGQTVRKLMMKYGHVNLVQAHIHRGAIIWDTDMEGNKIFGVENPCLCKPPFYKKIVNWVQGYTIIEKVGGIWQPRIKIF